MVGLSNGMYTARQLAVFVFSLPIRTEDCVFLHTVYSVNNNEAYIVGYTELAFALPQYERIPYHFLIHHQQRGVIVIVHRYFCWAKNLNSKKEPQH